MGQQKKIQLRRLNGYSWSVIVAFICATFAMQYHTVVVSFDDFFLTLLLIVMMVYWCEKSIHYIKQPECNLKKIELFYRDLCILTFSFFLACLISLVFAYNNRAVSRSKCNKVKFISPISFKIKSVIRKEQLCWAFPV